MIRAFARLGLIAGASLILIIFAVLLVRNLGTMQAFSPPPHPWFQHSYWHVFAPECGQDFSPPSGDWIVQIGVRSVEQVWMLDCPDQNLTLEELLARSAHPNWLMQVKANDSANLDKLVEIAGKHDQYKKFAVVSDSQRVSRFLRKKAPQWLYAADPSSLLRMQMFTSLWVETAMDFWPDFVLASPDLTRPAHLSPRLAQELERRHKRILWNEANEQKPDFPIHGIVTTRPVQ